MRSRAHIYVLPQLDGSGKAARARLAAIDARYREQTPTRPNPPVELFELGRQAGTGSDQDGGVA